MDQQRPQIKLPLPKTEEEQIGKASFRNGPPRLRINQSATEKLNDLWKTTNDIRIAAMYAESNKLLSNSGPSRAITNLH